MDRSKQIKLALAIGLLVVAGAVFAWQFLGGDAPPKNTRQPTQEEVQQQEEIQEEQQRAIDAGEAQQGGA